MKTELVKAFFKYNLEYTEKYELLMPNSPKTDDDLEELIPALTEAIEKGKTLEELGYSALAEKYYKPGLHSEARLMSFRSNQR